MLKSCPDPKEEQDLQFKLRCRLKVFDNDTVDTFPNWHSLVSAASRYRLLFVGSCSPVLKVIHTKYIENCSSKDKDISNYPSRTIPLPNVPLHISVNCDCTTLAVVLEKNDCPTVLFYDIQSFYKQNVAIIGEARLSPTPGVLITEVGWNPALPGVFTACKNNGSLAVYEIKANSMDFNEIPPAANACCFCWSPKGKRIAVGSNNGKITQYKSDLKPIAIISEPPLDGSYSLISLQWVASYQFVGIYQSVEQGDQTKLIVIDAPKTGENIYTNYEDICYSGCTRKPHFYMIFQQQWNILMVASSNSSELGVLGASGERWLQWTLSDTARAELPLTDNHQDTFPVGVTFDTSPNQPVPWGEANIPACPYLVLLSHTGIMCIFDVINLKPGAPRVCCAPDNVIDTSDLSLFTTTQPNTIDINLEDPAPKSITASAPIVPQQSPVTRPDVAVSSFSFARQPHTFQTEVTRTFVAAPVAKSATPSVASTFSLHARPHGESIAGELQTSSSLAFGDSATTGDACQPKPVRNRTAEEASLTDESVFLLEKMIREECACLEVELRALLMQGRMGVKVNIGDENQKMQLINEVQEAQTFIEEIVEVCLGQSAEVHSLKQDLIFCWALYEDTLSRYNLCKGETMFLLLKSQPLDPMAERRQIGAKKALYYIEAQMCQASKTLDEQWDRFQDYAKKSHRTQQMPTMEAIFQTMVRQNAILQKQMYMLKDIHYNVKRKSTVFDLDESHVLLTLGKSAQVESEMEKLAIGSEAIQKHYYEKTVHRTQIFTEKKNDKLREVLKTRSVTHVSSMMPHLLSILDTSRAKRMLLQNTRISPVSKPSQIESGLQFVQSTPIKKLQPQPKPLPSKSLLKQSDTPSATADFQPLCKAVPSAFASTAQSQSKLSNFHSRSVSTSTPLSVNKNTVSSTLGSTFIANMEQCSTLMESNGNGPKPSVLVNKSSTFSLPKTPVASSAFSFSPSKPMTCGDSTTLQSNVVPMTGASTKVLASGSAAFNETPQLATLNFESTCTTTLTSTIKPKTTAASTTNRPLYPSSTAPLGVTTTAAPNLPKITAPLAPSTVSLGSIANQNTSGPVALSRVTVSSDNLSVESEDSIFANKFSKVVTAPTTSLFSAFSPNLVSDSTSSTTSVLGDVSLTTNSSTSLSSGTVTVAAGSTNTSGLSNATTATFSLGQAMTVSSDIATERTRTTNIDVLGIQSPTIAPESLSFGSAASLGSKSTTTTSITMRAPIFGSNVTSLSSTAEFSPTTVGLAFSSTAASSGHSIFCSGTTSTILKSITSSSSTLGSGTPSSLSGGSIFGTTPTSTSSRTIFGAIPTSTASVISTTTVATTSSKSAPVIASAVSTTLGCDSIFGGSTTSFFTSGKTSGSTIFGGITTSTSSMFGANLTTTGSIFGSVSASSTPSVFGGTAPVSTTSSVFRSTGSPRVSTTQSVFGNSSPAFCQPTVFDQTASMLGSAAASQSGSSIFGTTPSMQGSSIFGAKTSSAVSSNQFGTEHISSPTQPIFGSSTSTVNEGDSVFGTATASASSPFDVSTPIFGGAKTIGTTSPFGQGGGVFGSNPAAKTMTTSSNSVFGQSATVFGQQQISSPSDPQLRSAFEPAPSGCFMQAAPGTAGTGSVLGFSGLSVNSNSGGGTSGFGSASSSPAPAANPFSRTSDKKTIFDSGGTGTGAFGSSTSIFGSASVGGLFHQTSPSGGSLRDGPFSVGGGTAIAQAGFAAATGVSPSAASGPAFGAPPSFGGAPAFAAGPAFSSSSNFGNPQSKLFGATVAQSQPANNNLQGGTFGGVAITGSPGFGNLANQNTIGFGNLAKHAQTSSSTPFSGNASFSTWR